MEKDKNFKRIGFVTMNSLKTAIRGRCPMSIKQVTDKILIVEDNDLTAKLLQHRFSFYFNDIDIVHTLEDCCKLLYSNDYSYILLDNILPNGLGFDELFRLARKQKNAKFILMTAYAVPRESFDEFMRLGYVLTVAEKTIGFDTHILNRVLVDVEVKHLKKELSCE